MENLGKAEQKLQLLESFVLNNVIIANDDVDENNSHEQIVPINDNTNVNESEMLIHQISSLMDYVLVYYTSAYVCYI